jgi:ribonuclease-3
VIRRLFRTRLKAAVGADVPKDAKTALQEIVTRLHGVLPSYETTGEGPDHAKTFNARVSVCGRMYGEGIGGSKKEAEQAAAEQAVVRLRLEGSDVDGGTAEGVTIDA